MEKNRLVVTNGYNGFFWSGLLLPENTVFRVFPCFFNLFRFLIASIIIL